MNQLLYKILLIALVVFVVVFASSHLTTRPKLWFDEGLTIEIARNFLLFKKLDVATSPGVFTGIPYDIGTNGYPLTIPLAGVFHIFGFGLAIARVYMIFWLVAAVLSFCFLVKSVFDKSTAIFASALLVSFAPFYGNGLTVTGEIPGFFFLAWGLFFLFKRNNYFLAGLFFALAGLSKPGVYFPLFPAFFLFLLFQERKKFFPKLTKFILGSMPAFLLWIGLAFPEPLTKATWQQASLLYRYPFGPDFSISQSILKNLLLIPFHPTLIYLALIVSIIIYWFLKSPGLALLKKKLAVFFLVYSALVFFFFLESPGWLRYLIGFQLLAFVFLFPALEMVSKKIFKKEPLQKKAALGVLAVLLSFQVFHLFFLRSDLFSPYPEKVARFINQGLEENKNYKVGILNAPDIASLIHPLRKFHIIKVGAGRPIYGRHPLLEEPLPQFIAFKGENDFVKEHQDILEENYSLVREMGGYSVYQLED